MEQLTYLMFDKDLDEHQGLMEDKANPTGQPIENSIFPKDAFKPDGMALGRPYPDLRWKNLKGMGSANDVCDVVAEYVFPLLKVHAADSTRSKHMKDRN